MKNLFVSCVTTFFFLSIFIGSIVWIFHPLGFGNNQFVRSPLPDFLTLFTNNEVSTIHLFEPVIGNAKASEGMEVVVSARAAVLYDLISGRTLYSKSPEEKLPMASLTKIMTAVVALEHKKEDDKYEVLASNLVGENSMGLEAGEIVSLEELLYGLILMSGNDASEVLASNFEGGRERFIDALNQKAKSLGLSNTHFTNPSGLAGDGDQHSTARDLLVITNYALSNFPQFKKISATASYVIERTKTHKEYYLENETNLLTSYPGVKGIKTGYTPEAGLCLVTYLEYDGHEIVGVLLGSENRRQEMKDLLDYSLKSLGTTPPLHD